MSAQEQAFFEVWDKIEAHSDLYNHRMMFDLGYKAAQERIIKVVEGYLHHDYLTGQNEDEMLDELYLSELVALIEGEK